MAKTNYVTGEILSADDMNDLGEEVNNNTEKLSGIEEGAEVNVQPDWNQTVTTEDDYIKNKPEVYNKSEINSKLTWVDLS